MTFPVVRFQRGVPATECCLFRARADRNRLRRLHRAGQPHGSIERPRHRTPKPARQCADCGAQKLIPKPKTRPHCAGGTTFDVRN